MQTGKRGLRNIMAFNPDILDTLTVDCMKHNYPLFIEHFGYEEADDHMANCFGAAWGKHCEYIWQWFDREVACAN